MRLSSFLPAGTTSYLPHHHHNHHHTNSNLLSLSILKPTSPTTRPRWPRMDSTTTTTTTTPISTAAAVNRRNHNKPKIVVIMGPTGSGKSRVSIDLATRSSSSSLLFPQQPEIINSDKIQVYAGLDTTTNKITMPDRRGVVHHLLGEVDPTERELTPSEFRQLASARISDILSRRKVPLIVGGSNSFIYALLAKRFDPESNVFSGSDPVSSELRYNCCFLWVDVSLPVLNQYLCKRVDEMLDSGMFEELAEFYESGRVDEVSRGGLVKAVGVPEFEGYFKFKTFSEDTEEQNVIRRGVVYEEAVGAIKDNTCRLAKRQAEKIKRLRDAGWDLWRIDATEAFRAAMGSPESTVAAGIWERQVVEPSMKIVKRFLEK